MTTTETTPNPVARVGVADVFSSAALDIREDSAASACRPAFVPILYILSADDLMDRAAAWLARRAGISVGHAAALAEAHGIGGAA